MSNSPQKKKEAIPDSYHSLLQGIKDQVRSSQLKAAVAVNQELIHLYWKIGSSLLTQQKEEGWGAKIIEKLAKDLRSSFPEMTGFSLTNIKYMVQFSREYPDFQISQQLVGQIPWGHNIILLQKLKTKEERLWYAKKTVENGWSRSVLVHWIDSGLQKRQGKAVTNFDLTLPPPQSDLAEQTLKDPYCFDFLTLREKFDEKELEEGLLNHIQKFLLELGAGFAFVGRQVELSVGGQDFYLDMLFYHLKLRCYVVVELKAKAFTPGDAGQLNFYLTAIDKLLKHPDDKPTIGLLLCKTKNQVVAEYALQDIDKPIGVAEYETKLVESLPENLKGSLPTIEELENELEQDIPNIEIPDKKKKDRKKSKK
jgi:predicted nuclease of restriction endonuclease-like (RecB) superfamily